MELPHVLDIRLKQAPFRATLPLTSYRLCREDDRICGGVC